MRITAEALESLESPAQEAREMPAVTRAPRRAFRRDYAKDARVVELWNSGLSVPAIAKEMGVSRIQAYRRLRRVCDEQGKKAP